MVWAEARLPEGRAKGDLDPVGAAFLDIFGTERPLSPKLKCSWSPKCTSLCSSFFFLSINGSFMCALSAVATGQKNVAMLYVVGPKGRDLSESFAHEARTFGRGLKALVLLEGMALP